MIDRTGKQLSNGEIINKVSLRGRTIWNELIVFILHLAGCVPLHNFRRFIYSLAGIRIGKGSALHMHARFYLPSNISIGEDTVIGEGVVLDGRDDLKIGNHVDIASNVMIYNAEHDIHSEDFHAVTSPVNVEDYVFIGPRAIILPGVTLGRGSVVGAGAVVTKSVQEFEVVGGVPAKVIGERQNKNPQYKLGRAAWFR